MTVGLPGTGVGGMFYLLSALAMPFREAYRSLRGRGTAAGWRAAAGQAAIAVAILAGLWATGWALGAALATTKPAIAFAGATRSRNVLRVATFILTFGTLAMVLGSVELLRLWLVRRPAAQQPKTQERRRPRRRAVAAGLWLACVGVAADPRAAAGQSPVHLATRLARADSDLNAGNAAAAAREYAAIVASDSGNSRAVYRLALLRRNDPAEALRLFRRYVDLEPSDPWGYMALGDELARTGRYREGLRWYDAALRLAPAERDAVIGRARVLARAGRTDAAIAAYRPWLALHPADTSSWRELGRLDLRAGRPGDAATALARAQALAPDAVTADRLTQARALAAPALVPLAGGTWDSDGNRTERAGAGAELAVMGSTRLGIRVARETARDSATSGFDQLALTMESQPRAAVKVDAAGGAALIDAPARRPPMMMSRASLPAIATGHVRARWRAPEGGPALEVRARRELLDATPTLIANRVVRSEVGGLLELPVTGPLRVRGIARAADIRDSAEVNHRTTLGGMVVYTVSPTVELSGQFHQMTYAHGTTAGYFAPRLGELLQGGAYFELDAPNAGVVAADVGLGVQRVADQGAALGPWRRAFSLYSLVTWPVAPGRDLRLELDLEDSLGSEAAVAGPWRYAAAALSLRWALQ